MSDKVSNYHSEPQISLVKGRVNIVLTIVRWPEKHQQINANIVLCSVSSTQKRPHRLFVQADYYNYYYIYCGSDP